jgi:hypothetical protein
MHVDRGSQRTGGPGGGGNSQCPFDPKTIAMWGKAIGVSENSSGLVQGRALPAEELTRFSSSASGDRSIRGTQLGSFNLLDSGKRTPMKNLLQRGGLTDCPPTCRSRRGDFCSSAFRHQRLALKALAASSNASPVNRVGRRMGRAVRPRRLLLIARPF